MRRSLRSRADTYNEPRMFGFAIKYCFCGPGEEPAAAPAAYALPPAQTPISPSEIEIVAKGKRGLLVPTADGVKEPQNRPVEIVYDGGMT
jgi:hypothetical protein